MADPIVARVSDLTSQLTDREREVLALIAEGLTVPEIARRLHRSRKTIESHRLSLGRKLGVNNRVKLARLAIQAGLSPVTAETAEVGTNGSASTKPSARDVDAAAGLDPRLVQLLEASRDGLSVLDRDDRIVLVNAALERIFGRPRGEMIDHRPEEFLHPTHRGPHRRTLERRRAEGSVQFTVDVQRPDGWLVRVEGTAQSLFDHDSNYIGSLTRIIERERWPAREVQADD